MKTSERILIFISEFTARNGYAPSMRQITEGVGLRSTSTVHGHIERLVAKGYLVKDDRKARTIAHTPVEVTYYEGDVPAEIIWEGRKYKLDED